MTRSKNLLVIMSDEHQARALSCAGHPLVQTPNLDKLAARGIRFTNAYTPSPICVPTRAAFASGRYVHDTRLWDNAMPYTGEPRGWGHALQNKGIRVESIGKLHYRDAEDPAGFDVEHIPMQVAGGHGMVWGSIRREDERVRKDGRMLGPYIGPGESNYMLDQYGLDKTDTPATSRRLGLPGNDRRGFGDRQDLCRVWPARHALGHRQLVRRADRASRERSRPRHEPDEPRDRGVGKDLDTVLQPGVTRTQLNDALHATGLIFTIDPGADASMGGMASTRASGTDTARNGNFRENVLALEVVLPNGEIKTIGSRARKSASGYDLTHLFIGDE